MKKFKTQEANFSLQISIELEHLISKLTKKFEKGDIDAETFLLYKKKAIELVDTNKELIRNWRLQLDE